MPWINRKDRLPIESPYSPIVLTSVVPKRSGYSAAKIGFVLDGVRHNDGIETFDNAGFVVTHKMPLPDLPIMESEPCR